MRRLSLLFAWYDIWIGVFIDTKKCKAYVFPIPMVGVVWDYGRLAVLGRPTMEELDEILDGGGYPHPRKYFPFWIKQLPDGYRWF